MTENLALNTDEYRCHLLFGHIVLLAVLHCREETVVVTGHAADPTLFQLYLLSREVILATNPSISAFLEATLLCIRVMLSLSSSNSLDFTLLMPLFYW